MRQNRTLPRIKIKISPRRQGGIAGPHGLHLLRRAALLPLTRWMFISEHPAWWVSSKMIEPRFSNRSGRVWHRHLCPSTRKVRARMGPCLCLHPSHQQHRQECLCHIIPIDVQPIRKLVQPRFRNGSRCGKQEEKNHRNALRKGNRKTIMRAAALF